VSERFGVERGLSAWTSIPGMFCCTSAATTLKAQCGVPIRWPARSSPATEPRWYLVHET
jgi:hypothetical protein